MSTEGVVHVLDDDPAVRDALAFLLRSAQLPVTIHDSATAFLRGVGALRSGCLITDVRMPEMDGIELLRHLQALQVNIPVIVITGHGDVPLAVEAMKCGAVDFLEKPFDDEVLLASVRSALGRQHEDDSRHAEKVEITQRLASLSLRERQVLEGLIVGSPNKIIAYDLGISPKTVEIYRANVMTKMQAGSLAELVRMALVSGVSSPMASRKAPPEKR